MSSSTAVALGAAAALFLLARNKAAPPQPPVMGVNLIHEPLMYRQNGGSSMSYTPPPLLARMQDVKAKGFNTIRVPMLWEAYEYWGQSQFLTYLNEVGAAAQAAGLKVLLDCCHQWRTSSTFSGTWGRGGGFPQSLTGGFLTEQDFWNAYLNNLTITSAPVWQLQANYILSIVGQVEMSPYASNVIGYEIQNEPYIWTPDQYAKVGLMHTSLASAIQHASSKPVFFDHVEPQTYSLGITGYVDPVNDGLTRPMTNNVIFAPHVYDKTDSASLTSLLQAYQALASGWQVPMLLGEWGVTDQASTKANVAAFQQMGVPWIRWVYDGMDRYALTLPQSSIAYSPQMAWVQPALDFATMRSRYTFGFYNGGANNYDPNVLPILQRYITTGGNGFAFGTGWFGIFPNALQVMQAPLDLTALQAFLAAKPAVSVLNYDLESGQSLYNDGSTGKTFTYPSITVPQAYTQAMQMIKSAGYYAAMGPNRTYWDAYIQTFDYSNVDMAIIQYQSMTSNPANYPAYVQAIQNAGSVIKSKNPNIVRYIQLAFRDAPPQDIISLMSQTRNYVDGVLVSYLPSPPSKVPCTYCTLQGLDQVLAAASAML